MPRQGYAVSGDQGKGLSGQHKILLEWHHALIFTIINLQKSFKWIKKIQKKTRSCLRGKDRKG